MPIRTENAKRYPRDWPAISMRIKQRAGFRCEAEGCGIPNGELGGRDHLGNWHKASTIDSNGRLPDEGDYGWCEGWPHRMRIVRCVLTVAHLDHTPENCADENLRCWCQRHHNRYDAAHRRAGIRARRRSARASGDLFQCEEAS